MYSDFFGGTKLQVFGKKNFAKKAAMPTFYPE